MIENVTEGSRRGEFHVGMALAQVVAHDRHVGSANAINYEPHWAVGARDLEPAAIDHGSNLLASPLRR